jgi:uroporphyrinogen-III synthase
MKSAVTRNPIVAPPKSRVNAKVTRVVREHGRSAAPPPAAADALCVELDAVRGLLDRLAMGRYDVVIFMTGSSVWALFELAQELGRHGELVRALQTTTTACSGPKAAAILRSFGLQPTLGERGLFTTHRLIYSLSQLKLAGRRVVRLNGVPSDAIAHGLRAQGARLRELSISLRRLPTRAGVADALRGGHEHRAE